MSKEEKKKREDQKNSNKVKKVLMPKGHCRVRVGAVGLHLAHYYNRKSLIFMTNFKTTTQTKR